MTKVVIKAADGTGAVESYHNANKKLETTSAGVTVTGNIAVTGTVDGRDLATDGTKLDGVAASATSVGGATGVDFNDNVKARFGTGNDLRLQHNGSNSYIQNYTGDLYIQDSSGSNDIYIKAGDDFIVKLNGEENAIHAKGDGAVELYHNNAKKFETTATGVDITGNCTITGNFRGNDNIKLNLGNGDDLKLFHNGTDSYIEDSGTGSLILDSNEIKFIKYGSNEVIAKFIGDGDVELYQNGNKKFHTYSEGCKITGFIKAANDAADSHWGDNTHNWHGIHTSEGTTTALFENSNDSNPYGLEVYFTDNTPDNNSNWFFNAADLSATRFRIYSDGDVWTSDSGTLSSDETLKENIVDASPKLEDLKKLKVRNFNWKSSFHPEKSKKKQLGFIAQEVEEVFPALITEHDIASSSPDNSHTPVMKKAIKQAWDPIIIKAMQELIAKVETLETKVAALEAK